MKQIITVNSTRIEQFEYEDSTQELIVVFKRGGTYKYREVPQETFHGLITTQSPGKAFETSIKGKFGFEKMP